jgi:hypothetical protein
VKKKNVILFILFYLQTLTCFGQLNFTEKINYLIDLEEDFNKSYTAKTLCCFSYLKNMIYLIRKQNFNVREDFVNKRLEGFYYSLRCSRLLTRFLEYYLAPSTPYVDLTRHIKPADLGQIYNAERACNSSDVNLESNFSYLARLFGSKMLLNTSTYIAHNLNNYFIEMRDVLLNKIMTRTELIRFPDQLHRIKLYLTYSSFFDDLPLNLMELPKGNEKANIEKFRNNPSLWRFFLFKRN